MKSIIALKAAVRDVIGKKVANLRENGQIPAVVYGKNEPAQSVSLAYSDFEKAYRLAGESSLVDLTVDNDGSVKVLVQEVQYNPLSNRFTHVDFYKVTMTEKLTANIPLKYVGEAPAVKSLGGILVKNIDEIEVRCLPGDLVHEIEVDITPLATFDDALYLKDLKVPKGMEVHGDPNGIVATVTAPISEEELKKLDEKPVEDVSKIEKSEKPKKEEGVE